MKMRLKTWKTVSLIVICSNMMALFYMLSRLDTKCKCIPDDMETVSMLEQSGGLDGRLNPFSEADFKSFSNTTRWAKAFASVTSKVQSIITIIIREFEDFENDIKKTLNSVLQILPNVSVLIITDDQPYPPLQLGIKLANVNILNLKIAPEQSYIQRPENYIKTSHVMFVPDSTRFTSVNQILKLISKLSTRRDADIVAAKVIGGKPKYSNVKVDLRKWTLSYFPVKSTADVSDVLEGNHVILMPSYLLLSTSHPWARPFPNSLFIQTALKGKKIFVMDDMVFESGETLFLDTHNRWKKDNLFTTRQQTFFHEYGIKKVILYNGDVELFGCTKESQRCFGTVLDDSPDYLYKNRWTPPCCLDHLRETTRYVFRILEKCGVRYWLEGGSLLGAVRYEDIIPWDYDVDIGIYKEDIAKCSWLKNAEKQTIIDSEGYVWEKAKEGDFLRVQFSKTNHLHVDIFPFYLRDGIMTKDSWFVNHKQDAEFPEHFLRPLSRIKFIGIYVSAPNKIREFIEFKFGKGAIEKPEYPAPDKLRLDINVTSV